MAEAAATPGTATSERVQAVKPLAWIMAGLSAVVFYGIIDLTTLADGANPDYEWKVPLEVSWGSLFTFVLAGSYAWIALRPHRAWPAVVQLAVAAVALTISSIIGADVRPLLLGVPVSGSAALFAWLSREVAGPFPRAFSVDWPVLLLAIAGAPMWLFYSLRAMEESRTKPAGPEDWMFQTMGINHWPVQGAAGLAVGACALVMAFWPAGRPLMRLSLSLSATLIGAAMLAYPDRDGAMPSPMWGVAMVIWGTLLALPVADRRMDAERGLDTAD
ncbi:hypothetical protein B1A87_011950 [Arthrobacter sp. KBS0703]|uniref:hypothetical protein n=1 Tax=Arthrobacter sp. KBS0703 TaxID=1955698 RepID=UPI00099015B2|nr:hypothetical protein [Arthrobacter sp. KBS0703]TSE16462.1 hypothetical protein B1A87_011950 [Arthrobacter sp. KBS0703]